MAGGRLTRASELRGIPRLGGSGGFDGRPSVSVNDSPSWTAPGFVATSKMTPASTVASATTAATRTVRRRGGHRFGAGVATGCGAGFAWGRGETVGLDRPANGFSGTTAAG